MSDKYAKKKMVFGFHQGTGYILNLVVHAETPPAEEDWSKYIAAIKSYDRDVPKVRTIVFTDGGGPDSAQRKMLNDFLRGRTVPTALITSSPVVRGITTALSWFNPQVKSFSPNDVELAFQYLGIPEGDQAAIWGQIKRLRQELGYENLKSIIRRP